MHPPSHHRAAAAAILLTVLGAVPVARAQDRNSHLVTAFHSLPLGFEEAVDGGELVARSGGARIRIGLDRIHFALGSRTEFTMRLAGARAGLRPQGEAPLPGRANYFLGNDPSKWRTEVVRYARVAYADVWDGVSCVFYGDGQRIEHDFVVAPGGDPEEIEIAYEGVQSLRLDAEGGLVLVGDWGEVRQAPPAIYQEVDGRRQAIAGGYTLRPGNRVGFRLGPRDGDRSVVIDPVIEYSTHLGGSQGDNIRGLAVDAQGNAYVAGHTGSVDFPVANALQAQVNNREDLFVAKLNPEGTALLYSTYLGGSGGSRGEWAFGIAVDPSGNAYVAGFTYSLDFPTVNPLYAAYGGNGTTWHGDAIVFKLNAAGSALVYSSYLPGWSWEQANDIAVDAEGNAYVAGGTSSRENPATAVQEGFPLDQPLPGDGMDAFVMKIRPDGQQRIFSKSLGGRRGDDVATSIAIDGQGNVYLAGTTRSSDFPVAHATQAANGGGGDVFVARLSADGSTLLFSTFLGGSDVEDRPGVAIDGEGNVVVAGRTVSQNFPVAQALQATRNGPSDGFVAKLTPDGGTLVFSTYLGGSLDDHFCDVAVDAQGKVYVVGWAISVDFPNQDPVLPPEEIYTHSTQVSSTGVPISGAAGARYGDCVVATLDPTGAHLLFGSYFYGWQWSEGHCVVACDRGLFLAGQTAGAIFSTPGAVQEQPLPDYNGFVARIDPRAGAFAAPLVGFGEGGRGKLQRARADGFSWRHAAWVNVWGYDEDFDPESYNAENGELHPAFGNLDADPQSEVVIGLGRGGRGWVAVLDDLPHRHQLIGWHPVQYAPNVDEVAVWPACGDIDGDGLDEVALGLGTGSWGAVEIARVSAIGAHNGDWIPLHHDLRFEVPWMNYNVAQGAVRPALGDFDGDGKADLALGLGPFRRAGGYFLTYRSTGSGFENPRWRRIPWGPYNSENGEVWPACGDVDGDGKADLVLGLGTYPAVGGMTLSYRSTGATFGPPRWFRVPWNAYNRVNGEVHPALRDLDGDGKADLIAGFGRGGEGRLLLASSNGSYFATEGWFAAGWQEYGVLNGATWPASGGR